MDVRIILLISQRRKSMNENELPSKAKTEEVVLKYIRKNTPKEYSQFNPIRLESVEIAKNTQMKEEFVDDALENLSKEAARIERVNVNFEFWLPLSEIGKKIKDELYSRNLAFPNLLLLRFVFLVGFYYFMKWLISIDQLRLISGGDYFVAGVIATGISILFTKFLYNRLYVINEKTRKLKHLKWFAWVFIIITTIIIILFSRGLHKKPAIGGLLISISIVADVIAVISFILLEYRQKE